MLCIYGVYFGPSRDACIDDVDTTGADGRQDETISFSCRDTEAAGARVPA